MAVVVAWAVEQEMVMQVHEGGLQVVAAWGWKEALLVAMSHCGVVHSPNNQSHAGRLQIQPLDLHRLRGKMRSLREVVRLQFEVGSVFELALRTTVTIGSVITACFVVGAEIRQTWRCWR